MLWNPVGRVYGANQLRDSPGFLKPRLLPNGPPIRRSSLRALTQKSRGRGDMRGDGVLDDPPHAFPPSTWESPKLGSETAPNLPRKGVGEVPLYPECLLGMELEMPKSSDCLEVEASPEVLDVWNYWLTVIHGEISRGVTPLLSKKRELAIRRGIKSYGASVCKLAISGCALSSFHMGKNARNKRYNDVTLILRSPEHVERFTTLALARGDEARQGFING